MTVRTAALARGEIDHELIWGWVAVTCLALGVWYVRLPNMPVFVCPFHAITGLPCLTCGGTRAFAALVSGDVVRSLRLNPLVAPALALSAVYVPYALLATHARLPRVRVALNARDWTLIRIAVALVVSAVWIYLVADGR